MNNKAQQTRTSINDDTITSSSETRSKLRMVDGTQDHNDHIISAIRNGTIHKGNISFELIKSVCSKVRTEDLWHELDRGRAILPSVSHLDQYMHSYGRIVSEPMRALLDQFELPSSSVELFDYGCGQGTASLLLAERFPSALTNIDSLTLIEPSQVALSRATEVANCVFEDSKIFSLNTTAEQLTVKKTAQTTTNHAIHLYSQVLDVPNIDAIELIEKSISSPGKHSLLAVSNARSNHGGHQVPMVYRWLSEQCKNGRLNIEKQEEFNIVTPGYDKSYHSYAFLVQLEVK